MVMIMANKALVTGISGQTGSYLAELLVSKGYEVFGIVRRHSIPQTQTLRIESLHTNKNVNLFYGDMTDSISIQNIISQIKPDELYHLAAQSHVQTSFELPQYTLNVNAGGTLTILETVKDIIPFTKVYVASTSEMFGNCVDADGFQRETTPMKPVSPYGISKFYGHQMCKIYRDAYELFICSGILFNHESSRRATNFVTSKVIVESLKVKKGISDSVLIGEMNAARDWGWAKDSANAMYLMLQQEYPKDYVIATGVTRTVRELCELVSGRLALDMSIYKTDAKFIRPEEVWFLRGDASLAKKELGWTPTVTFEEMIDEMIAHFTKHFDYYVYSPHKS